MTIDVNVLRGRLREFADQAASRSKALSDLGANQDAQFEAGRQAAFVTALSQLTLSEMEAARERDEDEDRIHPGSPSGWEDGQDVYAQGVNLSALDRLEEFSRQAGGAVDMTTGTVYSDADEGL